MLTKCDYCLTTRTERGELHRHSWKGRPVAYSFFGAFRVWCENPFLLCICMYVCICITQIYRYVCSVCVLPVWVCTCVSKHAHVHHVWKSEGHVSFLDSSPAHPASGSKASTGITAGLSHSPSTDMMLGSELWSWHTGSAFSTNP